MPKSSSVYICQQCGNESAKWMGRCPMCGEWNSLVETKFDKTIKYSKNVRTKASDIAPVNLGKVKITSKNRITTGISEIDQVLGGGMISGQVMLLAGEPGIGKSTLTLQISDGFGRVVYVSGEESAHQIKLRADRLGVGQKNVEIVGETNVDVVVGYLEGLPEKKLPEFLVIDSIQTMYTEELSGQPGSVGQVRESCLRLVRWAKKFEVPIMIVGHVTKSGNVAGPATLVHMVDTVLWFEGESDGVVRVMKVTKNRFGPTDEIGVFKMEEKGLQEVDIMENMFISEERARKPGTVVTSIMEGTRPLLVEIQALVAPTKMAYPRRVAQGVDSRKLELIVAILSKRLSVPIHEWDVYLNAVGGIVVRDPAVDVAIAMSLLSSYFDKPVSVGVVAFGEVGLLGEVRPPSFEGKRIKHAKKLGYREIVSSKGFGDLSSIKKRFF